MPLWRADARAATLAAMPSGSSIWAHGPAFLTGLIVAAYWMRVIRMVLRAKRREGHDAAFVPRERLGRALRYIWAPVIGLWIVLPLASALGRGLPRIIKPLWDYTRHLRYIGPPISWSALVVVVFSYIATLICWQKMGKSWRMGIDPDDKTALVCTGPYAYIRHPIYALSSLLMLMTLVIVPSPLMVAAGVIHLALLQWEARREERHLLRVHGDEYRRYASRAGRFLPKLGDGEYPDDARQ
jgi:protein-S-isoprenylcysteine O-methyltransferase Ste14